MLDLPLVKVDASLLGLTSRWSKLMLACLALGAVDAGLLGLTSRWSKLMLAILG